MSLRHTLFAVSTLAASAALVGCHNDEFDPNAETGSVAVGDTVVLTTDGKVSSFNRTPPSALLGTRTVKGLAGGETLLAIDFRPAQSKIYALSSQGNVYVLDPATGSVSTKVALTPNTTTPINTACMPAVTQFTALSGTEFGIDFNPSVDRLRIVSDSGQNLRVNVDNGMTTVDCPLMVDTTASKTSAAAYTNSVPGRGVQPTADTTALFYIDASTDQLLNTTAPNNGTLAMVGPLGVDVSAVNGFDTIASLSGTTFTNTSFAVFTVGGSNGLYRIDLATGAATAVASFTSTGTLRGLALK
ncbi:MAG: DUF4394 domain-containing protein [Pseudomonadota bacterium]